MLFSLKSVFATAPHKRAAQTLYGAIVDHARSRDFFAELCVPDTAAGRYAMVALHVFVVIDRLGRAPGQGKVPQALVDVVFDDLDRNLREMGVGDLSVGKQVKALARHFYAMAAACRDGLNRGDPELAAALSDYVYGDETPRQEALAAMASYLRACVSRLENQDADDILQGRVTFPVPPQGTDR